MCIKKIKIGKIEIKNNVFLAPMAGITDRAFRKICAKQGAGLVYTEMISAKAIVYNDAKTMEMLKCDISGMPRAVQLFASDEKILCNAIKIIEKDVDIIDINMGCPVPKIVSNGEGSALLKDISKIEKMIKSAVDVTDKPITVKIRKGYDEINAVEVAKVAERAGASLITIHGRLRKDFYLGKSDLDIIKHVKENVSVPVIGNGDVVDYITFKNMIETTNVDGVMIGRGALGNPWIFSNILNNKEVQKNGIVIYEMIKNHYIDEIKNKGEYIAVREMRKHIGWYLKGLKDNISIKTKINMLANSEEVLSVLKEYLINI